MWRYSVSSKGIGAGTLVYEEPDAAMSLGVWRTRDARYMVLQGASDSSSYIKVLDTSNTAGVQPTRPELAPRLFGQAKQLEISSQSVLEAATSTSIHALTA